MIALHSIDQKYQIWVRFVLILLPVSVLYILYAVNLIRWKDDARSGYVTSLASGPNLIAEVADDGSEAGFQAGDIIVAVDGMRFSTYGEFYTKIRSDKPKTYVYTILRDGKLFEITTTTRKMGIGEVLRWSGPLFLIGLIYTCMGIIIFLMKPTARESGLFFIMTCFIGTFVSFAAPSGIIRPLPLYAVRHLIRFFMPATVIHLAIVFPQKRSFLKGRPWLWLAPYIISLVLLAAFIATAKSYWDFSPLLMTAVHIYLILGVLIFLLFQVWNIAKSTSVVVRLQSQVILLGIGISFLVPVTDLLLRNIWHTYLLPDLSISFALFLSVFPLSIAYTIIKHDLFDIDVIVRRTYGYILSTGAIVGAYGLLVLSLDILFQSSEAARSPLFSIVFALSVVFFFRPLHERLQRFVDRVFYRQHYDYRKTIRNISEAMISILDAEQIRKTLIGSVVGEMFLENGMLFLSEPGGASFALQTTEGESHAIPCPDRMAREDRLPSLLNEKKDAIFAHEAELNPAYESFREPLRNTFESFRSEVMLPMMYKDQMQGIISLGRKKSGKMFTREDLDLLKTIANQSAVALENARLFKENIDKCRMEEELAIARDLQMSMLPAECPQIAGFRIAASSIPAREVGGDFFDFIEMGEHRLGFLIGDVTGKSVSGALIMAASRSVFRMLSEQAFSVGEIMNHANRRMKKDIKGGMFVALLYAVIDSESRTLSLSSAGQTQPILLRAKTGESTLLETEGDTFPLGILDDADYRETRIRLEPGDKVVFYTDGIVEAMNTEQQIFGFDRLMALIGNNGRTPADALLRVLIDQVNAFAGDAPQHDDLTVIVLSVDGNGPAASAEQDELETHVHE